MLPESSALSSPKRVAMPENMGIAHALLPMKCWGNESGCVCSRQRWTDKKGEGIWPLANYCKILKLKTSSSNETWVTMKESQI